MNAPRTRDPSGAAPTTPSDRSVGLLFATVSALAALYVGFRLSSPAGGAALSALCVALLLVAWRAPALLAPLNRAWMALGHLLGRIVSPIVLGAIFFLVITPVALVGRWRGRDELRLRRRAGATSHWIDRERPGPQPESFRNQF